MGCVWPRIAVLCSSPLLQTTSAADIYWPEPHMVSSLQTRHRHQRRASCNSFVRNSVITLSSEPSQDLSRVSSVKLCCSLGSPSVARLSLSVLAPELPGLTWPGPAVTRGSVRNICVSWRELQQLSHTGHRGPNNILPIISFLDKMKSLHSREERPCST